MSRHWATQRERGTVFSMKLITWIAFTFGRRVSRALLYPVCLYFVLFAPAGVRASRQYRSLLAGRPGAVFQHHFVFASVHSTAPSYSPGGKTSVRVVRLVYRLADKNRADALPRARAADVTRDIGHHCRRGGEYDDVRGKPRRLTVIASFGGASYEYSIGTADS
jgi:hypothetical protein